MASFWRAGQRLLCPFTITKGITEDGKVAVCAMDTSLVCFVLFLFCAWSDWKKGHIYNWVIIGSVVIGLVIIARAASVGRLLLCLVHGLLMAGCFFFLYRVGGVGAGDVKLVFAVGVLLPPEVAWQAIAWGSIFTGGHVLWSAARRGALRLVMTGVLNLLRFGVHGSAQRHTVKQLPVQLAVPFGFWLSMAGLVSLAKG